MRLSDQDFQAIAEALLLKNRVFVHKKTGYQLAFPEQKNSSVTTDEGYVLLENTALQDYVRIDPPPQDSPLFKNMHEHFILSLQCPLEQQAHLLVTVELYKGTGDENPFLRSLEQLGKLPSWLQFEQSTYENFVRECVYPYNEQLVFIQ